jgi:hypothetical protein
MSTRRFAAAGAAGFGVLAVYSAGLLAIEWSTSQDFVRNFFTDIEGPVPFYAVNTTLSVFLLWTAAVLFLVAAACTADDRGAARWRRFFLSQVCVFAFLGMDDRFKFHEWSARHLGIGDHWVLMAVAVAEAALLVLLGGALVWRSRSVLLLGAGTALFGVMFLIDACFPHDMVLRLSLEDLAKTWSAALFCLWAWSLCSRSIDRLRTAPLRGDRRPWPDARPS